MTARRRPRPSRGAEPVCATARFMRPAADLTLHDSYHCSRYNTNTGVLTEEMFRDVFAEVRRRLDS